MKSKTKSLPEQLSDIQFPLQEGRAKQEAEKMAERIAERVNEQTGDVPVIEPEETAPTSRRRRASV